jgi:hypothetical protein
VPGALQAGLLLVMIWLVWSYTALPGVHPDRAG